MPGTRPGMTVENMDEAEKPMSDAPPLRSYGRRKGRPLSARKERLLGELLPRLRLDLKGPRRSRLRELFPCRSREVWLEIGFGSGEHLLWQAEHHKDVGPDRLRAVHQRGREPAWSGRGLGISKTIRIHDGDARDVLAWLPDRSIGRMFILFPDPWPKKRQIKRRLLVARNGQGARAGADARAASSDLPATSATMRSKRWQSLSDAAPSRWREIKAGGDLPTGRKPDTSARR